MMHLSVTFDYELFFGKNYGSDDEVLFSPTYRLIEVLEKKGVSATFFADVCSIPIANKYNQSLYIEKFTKQIQYMKQHGQDVQLHLHPHWFYSKWENGEWIFSERGYRIHDFEKNNEVSKIINDGIKYLRDSILPVDNNYKCIAYRAGGFSIQPHKNIVATLYDSGIRIDSSIAPHLYTMSETHFYDYRKTIENINWFISENSEWNVNNNNGKCLFELPIATIDKNPIIFSLKRILKPHTIKLNLGAKRGVYIKTDEKQESKFRKVIKYVFSYNAISLDAYSADYLYKQVKRLFKKNKRQECYVAIIGHPKLVNEAYIDNLCKFIDLIHKDPNFNFISVSDVYIKEQSRWN